MKKDIHPKYYQNAKVSCACGNTFTTGSILPQIRVEICAACHPFYTGKQKLVDTEGRVEKFISKREKARLVKEQTKKLKKKIIEKTDERPKTLREMLMRQGQG